MRVTVITPSRNQGLYIEDCLRSVHGQTHRDIEHIVLDGMSTDASAEIAARYPCTFLQRKDSGPAQAINRGLDMATGDIVCWLNTDDLFWSNTTLEHIVGLFTEFPEIDMITGNGYWVDEQGKLLAPFVGRADRMCAYWIRKADQILQPATFWRRHSLRLDESLHYAFDWKLWIECLQGGMSLLYVPEYFARYRAQPSSLTIQDTANRKREIYQMVKKYGPGRPQIAWCWMVWKLYALSEALQAQLIKRLTIKANEILSRMSGDSISSG